MQQTPMKALEAPTEHSTANHARFENTYREEAHRLAGPFKKTASICHSMLRLFA